MKFTYKQKVQFYNDWKVKNRSSRYIASKYHVNRTFVEYMVDLADRHGISVLKHKYTYYSPEYKKNAINRVLLYHESANEVSLDLGLSNQGILPRWIKEYKANGYNVIERKRGRKPDGSQTQKDCRGTREGECRASPEERDSYDTDRILKKIRCLGFGKREIRKAEIAQAMTELRQEIKRPLNFILKAIESDPSLPHLPRSDYYYYSSHEDPDWKYDDLMNTIIWIFYEHKGRYGYRRITAQLSKDGWKINQGQNKSTLIHSDAL